MTNLYIRVVDGQPQLRPYTIDQLKLHLHNHSGMVLPAVLTDDLLSHYGYYPVSINSTTEVEERLLRYTTSEITRIYLDENGIWNIDMEQVINNHMLLQDWELVKRTRNKLLLNTDWTENSDILTTETRKRYHAYRELIRDIVRISAYPCDVKFPQPPTLMYIDDVENKKMLDSRQKVTDKEVEQLRGTMPKATELQNAWFNFITEWHKLDFNNDKAIVANLILAYTTTSLEEVLRDKTTDVL